MRSIQRIVLLVAVSICLPLTAKTAERQKVAQFSSYASVGLKQGKRYDFDVYQDDLNRTPAWQTNEEFPPLSPRKAEAAARRQLDKLVEHAERWNRRIVALHQMSDSDKWVYVVHFSGFHPPGVLDGAVPQMRLVVLMDGRALEPRVSPHRIGKTNR
jgi:hypothetical protein